MSSANRPRGFERDRHGRGMRRSLLGHLRIIGRGPSSFEQIVEGACDFLRHAYPEDLGSMRCLITDAPAVSESSEGVKRWAARPEDLTIVIYRLPIERLGHVRRTDPMHERMHIEEYVFQAAAALIGKDPWDLLGGD